MLSGSLAELAVQDLWVDILEGSICWRRTPFFDLNGTSTSFDASSVHLLDHRPAKADAAAWKLMPTFRSNASHHAKPKSGQAWSVHCRVRFEPCSLDTESVEQGADMESVEQSAQLGTRLPTNVFWGLTGPPTKA